MTTASPNPGLSRKVTTGAFWMVLLRLALRLMGFVNVIILARLLTPADFGLVAMAMSFLAMLEAFSALGLNLALIREEGSERSVYDTAFTLSLIRCLIIAGGLVVFADQAADFFGDPRLGAIIYVVAIGIILQGVENIGIIDFRKHFRFDREFRFNLVFRLVGVVATVILALLWRDYWALVWGTIASRLVRTVLSYTMHEYRPRLSLAAWRKLFGFSMWIWFSGVAMFLSEKGLTLIVGRFGSSRDAGLYSVGQEMGDLPRTELLQPIAAVLFSGFAAVKGDILRFREVFTTAVGALHLMTVPALVGLALISRDFTLVVFGPNWLDMAPLIALVALSGCLSVLPNIGGMALVALGHTGADAIIGVGAALARLGLVLWLIQGHGLVGVGWGILISFVLQLPVCILVARRYFGFSIVAMGRDLWRTLLSATAMACLVLLLQDQMLEAGISPVLRLGIAAAIGAAAFVAAQLILWRISGGSEGPEAYLLREIGNRTDTMRKRFSFGRSA